MLKRISYKDQVKCDYVVRGAMSAIAGILILSNNTICMLAASILLILDFVLFVKIHISKKEEADEMAEAHENDAVKYAFYIGSAILIIMALITFPAIKTMFNYEIDLNNSISYILLIYLGLMDLIVGIIFNILEKD